jgi:ABC-type multidrug transport system fused ATPase/permease subunit
MIHHTLLNSIMKSPMSFFDTNPTGRIINRFSTDVDTMDGMIPFQMGDLLWCFMDVVTTLTMICYATPTFLIVILPIIIVFVIVQRFYIVTSRQLKRLYSISKSPIFSHFSETVSGAPTIRAYRVIELIKWREYLKPIYSPPALAP